MKSNLPKYILFSTADDENSIIWPGYKQITNAFRPLSWMSLPQGQISRAIYERIE